MFPEIMATTNRIVTVTDPESSLDDGNDVCEGDTYLPIETDDIPNKTNNPVFMEEDVNLDNGQFDFQVLRLGEKLTPSANMYNG